MAPSPFRRCDYCGCTDQPQGTRFERRAWTFFNATRKLACPSCERTGRTEDDHARAVIERHRDLLHYRLVAESEEPYGFPMHQRFDRIKAQYPDAILLFREGDFYTSIGIDALKLERILGVRPLDVLVGGKTMPLGRFPFHALDIYLPALVRAGHRVAICDLTDTPLLGRGAGGEGIPVSSSAVENGAGGEVSEPFGDPPLPKTHRLMLKGHASEVDVHLSGGRYFGLDGTWDIPTTDRSIRRVVLRYRLDEPQPALYGEEHAGQLVADPMVRPIPKPKAVDGVQLVPAHLLDRSSREGQVAVPVKAVEVFSFLGQRFYLIKDVAVEIGAPSNWLVVHASGIGLGLRPDRSRTKAIADSAALLEKAYETFGEKKLMEVLRNSTEARRAAALPLPKFYTEPSMAAEPVEQYRRIKPLYKDALLILRDHLGYFMMYNDAKKACDLIGLQYAGNGLFRIANSCLEDVLDRLVKNGNRVAMVIDPAVDDPANARQTDLWDAILANDKVAA